MPHKKPLEHGQDSDRELEMDFLGGLFLTPAKFDELSEIDFKIDYLSVPFHQKIARGIIQNYETKTSVSLNDLHYYLKSVGEDDKLLLRHITLEKTPHSHNVLDDARLLKKLYLRREGKNLCYGLQIALNDPMKEPEEELSSYGEQIVNLYTPEIHTMTEHEALGAEQDRYHKGLDPKYTFGFKDLDRKLGGYVDGHLNVIAARPNEGKTSLMMALAKHYLQNQMKVLFVSLETGKISFYSRLIPIWTNVRAHEYTHHPNQLTEEEKKMADRAILQIAQNPPTVITGRSYSAQELRPILRRFRRQSDYCVAFIDHIHNMKHARMESIYAQLTETAQELQSICYEIKLPMFVAAQLRKGPPNVLIHRPTSDDVRDSSQIEAVADLLILIHRPSRYNSEAVDLKSKKDCLIVAKNRWGETGDVPITWHRTYARFENAA